MLGDWETFYLMLGSSAAVLIGLLFVVVTLSSEGSDDRVVLAQRIFMNPTVFHFIAVFVTSAVALSAGVPATAGGAIVFVTAVIGLWMSIAAIVRLARGSINATDGLDYLTYGALPVAIYLALLASAVCLALEQPLAPYGLAASALGLLITGIVAAWDLATWLSHHRTG